MAKVIVSRGPGSGEGFVLGDLTIIGRSLEANVRVDDLTVSRKHAQITKGPDGYTLRDLGSGNGTLLNDQRIEGATLLKDNDQIGVSNVVFVFRDDVRPPAEKKPDGAMGSTTVSIVDGPAATSAIVESVDLEDQEKIEGVVTSETAFEDLCKMHKRLKTVIDIGNALGTVLDEKKQFQLILDKLFEVFTQADRGFVILKDASTRRLRPSAAKVRDGDDAAQQVSISRTIAKEVIEKRKGILSSDAMGDDRFAGGASIVNFQIRSMMCVPLIAHDEIQGLIHVDTTRPTEHFTVDDLSLLVAIANQTALSVANSRMHEQLLAQERMARDLEFAQKVQQSFLPDAVPKIEGFEFQQAYKAALQVGGDFYDFIHLGGPEWGLVVGDVSGKGVSAALLMAKLMSDVRVFALAEHEPTPTLNRLNNHLAAGGTEDVFVTLLFMKLDVERKALTIGNAGHLPPMVRRGEGGSIIRIEDSINYPLGVLPDTEFEQAEFQLEKGDALAIFTDGIIEAMNAKKEQYGFDRLEAAMSDPAASPAKLVQIVLSDVKKFVGKTPQSDDLTLVCFGPV